MTAARRLSHAPRHAPRPDAAPLPPVAAAAFTDRLDALRRRIETAYAEATAPLVDATVEVRAVVTALDALAGEDRFDAAASPQTIGATVAAVEARAEEERHARAGVGRRLAEADGAIARLRRLADTIGMVALSARVAAAQVPRESRVHGIFTAEMAESAGQLVAAAGEIEQARGALAGLMASLEAADAEFAALRLDEARGRLAEAEARLEAGAERDREAREAARRSAEAISRRLAELVAALQTGDAICQRLEHAADAGRALADPEGGAATIGPAAGAAAATLIAAQIEAAAEEFAARTRDGDQAAQRLRAELARRGEVERGAAASGLAAMTGTLAAAEAGLGAATALRTRISEVLAGLRDALGALGGKLARLRRVEQQIQTLSINASISCARAGAAGRALMVISHEMAELSAQVRGATRDAAAALENAGAAAEAMIEAGQASGRLPAMRAALEAARADLARRRAAQERTEAALDAARAQCDGLFAALDAMRPGLLPMATALTALAKETPAPDPGAPQPDADDLAAARAWFAARRRACSMEAERRIFDRTVPERYRPAADAAPPPAAAPAGEFEEF